MCFYFCAARVPRAGRLLTPGRRLQTRAGGLHAAIGRTFRATSRLHAVHPRKYFLARRVRAASAALRIRILGLRGPSVASFFPSGGLQNGADALGTELARL